MTFYHFTSRRHLPVILTDGLLKPTESNVSPDEAHAGPPVVWLLDLPEIPVDSHGLRMPEGVDLDKTEVRFEVNVPAIHWLDWEWTSMMDRQWREIIIRVGGGERAADHWYVWPAPIKRNRWISVEVGGQAIPTMLDHPDFDTL